MVRKKKIYIHVCNVVFVVLRVKYVCSKVLEWDSVLTHFFKIFTFYNFIKLNNFSTFVPNNKNLYNERKMIKNLSPELVLEHLASKKNTYKQARVHTHTLQINMKIVAIVQERKQEKQKNLRYTTCH